MSEDCGGYTGYGCYEGCDCCPLSGVGCRNLIDQSLNQQINQCFIPGEITVGLIHTPIT